MHSDYDQLDRRILVELLQDARLSFREVAKKSKCSVVTAAHRIRRMEKSGIVKGYSAIIDHEKLGYGITTVTEVTVSRGRLLEVQKEIARMPSVCAVYDVTGVEDTIVISKFKSREDVSSFTKAILTLPHVERTNTHVVLNTCKEDFRCPILS